MQATTKLFPLLLALGALALQGCENVSVDTSGGGDPPAGVIQGTVSYYGPPPCSQNGHIVGNAVILVFDARNPPPPNGLGVTAANFGVVSGDTLFQNWPVTTGTAKVCPDANAPPYYATAGYAISPMSAGQYVMQGFFDYTGDFFATFKFRQLPEATDVGGGYIDVLAAQQLFTNGVQVVPADGGLPYYPVQEQQTDPNYLPSFLPVNIGTQGPTPLTSIRSIPSFTMPDNGYLAADVPVTLAATLPLSRPYFYPTGVAPSSITTTIPTPLTPIVSNGSSSDRPQPRPP